MDPSDIVLWHFIQKGGINDKPLIPCPSHKRAPKKQRLHRQQRMMQTKSEICAIVEQPNYDITIIAILLLLFGLIKN